MRMQHACGVCFKICVPAKSHGVCKGIDVSLKSNENWGLKSLILPTSLKTCRAGLLSETPARESGRMNADCE
jgi:hypothetical protein